MAKRSWQQRSIWTVIPGRDLLDFSAARGEAQGIEAQIS
jgi:hypothetical protein